MRPIDGDSLKEEILNLTITITGIRAGKGVLVEFMREYRKTILRTIDEQPTIEVEPVVHGEWILDEYGNPHCSKCEHVQDAQTNYCSECGAEMSCMSKTLTPADIRKLQPELEAYRVQHIAEVTKMLKGIEELDKREGDQNE